MQCCAHVGTLVFAELDGRRATRINPSELDLTMVGNWLFFRADCDCIFSNFAAGVGEQCRAGIDSHRPLRPFFLNLRKT